MKPVIIEHYKCLYDPYMRFNIAFSLDEYAVFTPEQREGKRKYQFEQHQICRDDYQMFDCEVVGVKSE